MNKYTTTYQSPAIAVIDVSIDSVLCTSLIEYPSNGGWDNVEEGIF